MRINATKNISKITQSMKMVSAAKLRGDQARLDKAQPFNVSIVLHTQLSFRRDWRRRVLVGYILEIVDVSVAAPFRSYMRRTGSNNRFVLGLGRLSGEGVLESACPDPGPYRLCHGVELERKLREGVARF